MQKNNVTKRSGILFNLISLNVRRAGVGKTSSVKGDDGVLDIDNTISLEATWHAMEDCVFNGLVRSIGVRYI